MSSKIKRISSTYDDILLTNSLATTHEISFTDEAAMVLFFPGTWTACNLTVYAKNPVNDTYYALKDDTGTAVTISSSVATASTALTMPDAIFPCNYVKLVTDNAANNAITVGAVSKG